MKVFLKFPWYDGAVYRRVEDNPHEVETELAKLPSTAQVVDILGKRAPVWKLRGEIDPALRVEAAVNEADARKFRNMREAFGEDKGLAEENVKLRAELAELKRAKDAEAKKAADEAAKKAAEAAKK